MINSRRRSKRLQRDIPITTTTYLQFQRQITMRSFSMLIRAGYCTFLVCASVLLCATNNALFPMLAVLASTPILIRFTLWHVQYITRETCVCVLLIQAFVSAILMLISHHNGRLIYKDAITTIPLLNLNAPKAPNELNRECGESAWIWSRLKRKVSTKSKYQFKYQQKAVGFMSQK